MAGPLRRPSRWRRTLVHARPNFTTAPTTRSRSMRWRRSEFEVAMKVETVTENMLFTTVRIETTTSRGTSSGTGFVFSYRQNDSDYLFLITNKHVINDASSGHFFFTLANDNGTKPLIGQRHDVFPDNFQSLWYGHADSAVDIAICPLVPILNQLDAEGKRPFFRSIPHTSIPEPGEIEDLDPLEEVIFIGYPNGLYDTVNLLPIIRRGTTATPPQLDYCGWPTFLIDASVFGGSSGSPVFLYYRSGYADRRGNVILSGHKSHFLGILAEVHIRQDYQRLELLPMITTSHVPATKATQMLDLGIVFKASAILDTVKQFLAAIGTVVS